MGIADIVDSLRKIPGAVTDDPAAAPRPRWWPSDRLDVVPRGIQISGTPVDVRMPGSNHPDITILPEPWIAGSWLDGGEGNKTVDLEPSPIEALAWYSSYHYSPTVWGIFVRSYGVERLAGLMMNAGIDEDDAFRSAFGYLLAHEYVHYRVDLLTTGAELASGRALFLSGRRLQHGRQPGYGLAEEGLGNAIAHRSLSADARRTALAAWLDRCPPGYRDWRAHGSGRQQRSWEAAVGEVATGSALPVFWTPTTQPPYKDEVPVFLVQDTPMPAFKQAVIGAVHVHETSDFLDDLNRLSKSDTKIRGAWERRKRMLSEGALGAGSHLETIDKRRGLYSVTVGSTVSGDRAGLVMGEPTWAAVALDRHDRLYARLKGMSL